MFGKQVFDGREFRGIEDLFQSQFRKKPAAVPIGNPVTYEVSRDARNERARHDFAHAEIPLGRESARSHEERGSGEGESERRGTDDGYEKRVLPDEKIGEKVLEHGLFLALALPIGFHRFPERLQEFVTVRTRFFHVFSDGEVGIRRVVDLQRVFQDVVAEFENDVHVFESHPGFDLHRIRRIGDSARLAAEQIRNRGPAVERAFVPSVFHVEHEIGRKYRKERERGDQCRYFAFSEVFEGVFHVFVLGVHRIEPQRILEYRRFHFFAAFVPVGFQPFEHVPGVSALVDGSAHRFGREKRRVGFYEDAFERDFLRRLVEVLRALVGEDAREPEHDFRRKFHRLSRECQIFAETMDDGLADGEFFYRFQKRRSGISRMDDERESEFFREGDLVREGGPLVRDFPLFDRRVVGKPVEIPSGFADGDYVPTFADEQFADGRKLCVHFLGAHVLRFAGMEADGGAVRIRMPFGERYGFFAGLGVTADLHGETHALFEHVGKHSVFFFGEFVEVRVGMGVEYHAPSVSPYRRFSIRVPHGF